ncbi:phosphatase PAP2 family protein, partial [Jatrophihabitans endophyticus]|uniref:phosphatase PAP2 family protein n=1 Tax=Jatrophihabitans endophyticus TaxID=1206085 RepID=UPI0019EF4256
MSRVAAFWACLGAFTALTVGLITIPAFGDVDESFTRAHPKSAWAPLVPWVRGYELFGQRGPTLLVFAPLIGWWAWRRRDRVPVVALVVAEVLLNGGVGVAKYGLGRVGPFAAGNAHRFFAGGDIYPSGHVSNAVVLYGLLAWLAPPRWRRRAVVAAVVLSVTVGAGTVFLRTHWLSDVLGGWLAGGLVLLGLPTVLGAVDGLCRRRDRSCADAPRIGGASA